MAAVLENHPADGEFQSGGPNLATLAVFVFLAQWNSFFLPLIMIVNNAAGRTLPLALSGLIGENVIDYSALIA